MKILTFETEDEWLRERRKYVTATMIARLAQSRSEWQRVWDERESGKTEFFGNRYTDWGKEREPRIAKWATNGDNKDDTPGVDSRLVPTNDVLYVADDGISAASPDMVSVPWSDERIGAEIKTVTAERAWVVPKGTKPEDIKNFVPKGYYNQVQWNIKVYEAEWWFLIWEVHYGFDEKTVERHWCVIYPDRERIKELESIRDEFLAGEWREQANEWRLESLVREYQRLREQIDALKEKQGGIKNEMAGLLEVGGSFSCEFGSVSVQAPRKSRRFNSQALANMHPDIFAEFYEVRAPNTDAPIVTVRGKSNA